MYLNVLIASTSMVVRCGPEVQELPWDETWERREHASYIFVFGVWGCLVLAWSFNTVIGQDLGYM